MMTSYAGVLIGIVLAVVVVDGSPISVDQPTPIKYTFRVEKLEFGDGLGDCTECESGGGIIIGNPEEPSNPYDDQGVNVCEFLKKACSDEDYHDEDFKKYPETYKIYLLACENYEYICGENEQYDYFIPDYPDIDQGSRVCMELEKACNEGVPEEIERIPEEKKMLSLMCKNYDDICGENEPDDSFIPDHPDISQEARICKELEEVCGETNLYEIEDDPEERRLLSLMCKNYEDICGENNDDEAEDSEDLDYLVPRNYPDIGHGGRVCKKMQEACGDEDYIDKFSDREEKKFFVLVCNNYEDICGENELDEEIKDFIKNHPIDRRHCAELERACKDEDYLDLIEDPEGKKKFLLICKNYESICGELDDDDIYNESYEEIFHQDEDDYYEDEATEEEGGTELEEDEDEEDEDDSYEDDYHDDDYYEDNEIKRYERANGILRTLKRRHALAHKKTNSKSLASKLHLLTKRKRRNV